MASIKMQETDFNMRAGYSKDANFLNYIFYKIWKKCLSYAYVISMMKSLI
jgi:hypothetical protein